MFQVNSEKELLEFLKIVSQEGVNIARQRLNEQNDPYVSEYLRDVASDRDTYRGLKEEEEEEIKQEPEEQEPKEQVPEEEDEGFEDNVKDSDSDENPAMKKALEMDSDEFGTSFDSVMTAINTLRAGRSLKDTAIRDQASYYYDGLSEVERKVLQTFLEEFAKILTGAISGKEAQDPSDDPLNITFSTGEKEKQAKQSAEEREKASLKPTQKSRSSEEDTSPPIRANQPQDLTEIRRKVRQLMRS